MSVSIDTSRTVPLHTYICAPQCGSFLSSRPPSPIPSHPVLLIRATPYPAALLGPSANPGILPASDTSAGKLLPDFLRGWGVFMPICGSTFRGADQAPPDFCTASACHMLAGLWLACRKMQAVVFCAPAAAGLNPLARILQKALARAVRLRVDGGVFLMALLPTQGAAYASRHV